MEIKDILKNARTKSGLTQEQAAVELYVSRQTISNWENGKSLPDIVSVLKMSDLYQISLDELLKGDKKMVEKITKDEISKKYEWLLTIMALISIVVGFVMNFTTLINGGDEYSTTYALIRGYVFEMGIVLMGFCGLAMLLSIKLDENTYNRYTFIIDFVRSFILLTLGVVSAGTVFVSKESQKTVWLIIGIFGIVIPIRSIYRSCRMYKESQEDRVEENDGESEA